MKLLKNMKFVQLGLSILFDIAFFVVLLTNEVLRNSVFSNSYLTILCMCMWALCIVTLIFLIFDIQQILVLEVSNHELSKEAYLDYLTGIPNRHSLDVFFRSYTDEEHLKDMGCGVIMLKDLDEINAKLGREKGDEVIQSFSNIFEAIGDRYGFVGRNGGNEYVALFEDCDDKKMEDFFHDLTESVNMYNRDEQNTPLHLSFAYVLNRNEGAKVITELIGIAYRKLGRVPENG